MNRTTVEPGPAPDASPIGRRVAFLSAPPGVDTKVLREVLARHGFDALTADDVNLPGSTLAEVVREGIHRADLFLAVVPHGVSADSVFFELGYAQALAKRTLVLLDPRDALPLGSRVGAPYLRARPDNAEAIDFGLTQLLAAPPRRAHGPGEPGERTKPLGVAGEELLRELRETPAPLTDERLEDIVVKALRRSGVAAVSKVTGPGGLADMAVWADDLEPLVGNPLLVEVRGELPDEEHLRALAEGLTRALEASASPWALVVYGSNGAQSPDEWLRGSRVLSVRAEDFLRAMRDTPFGEVVRRLRNARVHAGT